MLDVVLCKDKKIIKEIDDACFLQKAYSYQQYTAMTMSEFYLLNLDSKHIGFVILNKVDNDYELIKIGILAQYRKQGYASYFLHYLLQNLSYKRFFLEVSEKNEQAIKLYRKMNFKEVNRRKEYYTDQTDAIVMEYLK